MIQHYRIFVRGLLVLIIFLSICLPLHAEPLMPNEVVIALIKGAHENNLDHILATSDLIKIAEGRHGYSPQGLSKLLRGIELHKIIFEPVKGNLFQDQKITVRLKAPIMMDFDLELRNADKIIQEDHYVVISVHP